MENPNLKVLLLGWDETMQGSDLGPAEAQSLLQTLASQTDLTAILPHLPEADQLALAHIVGLDTLTPEALQALTTSRIAGEWQAPAAPYVGASVPAPGSTTGQTKADFSDETADSATQGQSLQNSPPDLLQTDEQAAQATEPGADEAHDLDQPANDLSPNAPTPTFRVSPIEFSADRATLRSLLDVLPDAPGDLNFQIIQYTRFATHLALREEFGVIYAPEWPVWLAGMEIRQMTSKPLVLHVHSLALDRDTADDRGWVLELERLALRRATLILAATEELSQRLQSAYDVAANRIQVVAAHDEDALTAALRFATTTA
jgi:hypothetical protein